jgi:hypothetical protein
METSSLLWENHLTQTEMGPSAALSPAGTPAAPQLQVLTPAAIITNLPSARMVPTFAIMATKITVLITLMKVASAAEALLIKRGIRRDAGAQAPKWPKGLLKLPITTVLLGDATLPVTSNRQSLTPHLALKTRLCSLRTFRDRAWPSSDTIVHRTFLA